MELYHIYSVFSICGLGFFFLLRKSTKEKIDPKDENKEVNPNMMTTINELQLKSSINSMDIQKLYLENYELRNKLDRIYANELNENINYYKNIVLMNEKIEYIQKCLLRKGF